MNPKKPATVRVISTLYTLQHDELPELTGGLAVEIPADKAQLALSLKGVVLALEPSTNPKEKDKS
jgi:hypothetical protein